MRALMILSLLISLVIVAILSIKRNETIPDTVKILAEESGLEAQSINTMNQVPDVVKRKLNHSLKQAEERNKRLLEEMDQQ